MYSAQYFWKKHNVKTVNIEILRCRSESISMNVSDLIIYIMKIMWRDLKKIRSNRFRDIQNSAKSPNFEWSCTYTGAEKRG